MIKGTERSVYQDPQPAGIPEQILNRVALGFEDLTRSLAYHPARRTAPLTPGFKTKIITTVGMLTVGLAAIIMKTSEGTTSVADYLGSKSAAVSTAANHIITSLGPEIINPNYDGSKSYTEFGINASKSGKQDNVFLNEVGEGIGFEFSFRNFSLFVKDRRNPIPLPENYIVQLLVTSRNPTSESEWDDILAAAKRSTGYQNASNEYYKRLNILPENRHFLDLIFSVPKEIKSLLPTSADFHSLSKKDFLFKLSYVHSLQAIRKMQQGLATQSNQMMNDNQLYATFGDQVRDNLPIRFTYIDPSIIQSIYQENQKGSK